MLITFILLAVLILSYNYVTNADRVRAMAEKYLTGLIGGRVKVHAATLSIFEGLRLEGVTVNVDDGKAADSLIFSAQSFDLLYDPGKILRGRIEAAQIIVQKPHVYLTENLDTNDWNFYRMARGSFMSSHPRPPLPGGPPPLPQVLLRNARVEISEIRAGRLNAIGYEALDGQIIPLPDAGAFSFELQTRGKEGIGPWARGTASVSGGPIDAELHDFDFGRDVRSMLWDNVREFWERHNMSGRIDVVRVHFQPSREGRGIKFRAETVLKDINASVPPEDWLTPDDIQRRASLRDGVMAMQSLYRLAGAPRMSSPAAPSAIPSSPADFVSTLIGTTSFELRGGSGRFIFTDAGVELKDVTGRVEQNAFVINGSLDGYSPDAPFSITLRSVDGDTLQIPAMPRYLTSLPPLVRDLYTILQPDGTCRLKVTVARKSAGTRPMIEGQVDVVDGVFSSIFFPYPLRQISGQITFGYDSVARADFVYVKNMHGRGVAGGPNQNSWIDLDGKVGPLGPEWPDPQVVIHIRGADVTSEPKLIAAFPKEVKEPLKIFDAENSGKFPTFHGSFSTTVLHRPGWAWRWTFDTDLHLDDASGRIVGFPYLLEHVKGDVQVRDGYVDIINARETRGDTKMRVDGRVTWGPITQSDMPSEDIHITTDVHVKVDNLPVDKQLLAAIPPDQAVWVKRIGLGGFADVEGRVYEGFENPAHPHAPVDPTDVKFDLNIALRDGTLWPEDGTFSVSNATGHAHLTNDYIELTEMHGRRGDAQVSGDGAIKWANGPPELAFHVKASDMTMDSSLYAILPADGRQYWDQIQPRGNVDADIMFRMPFPQLLESSTTRPAGQRGFTLAPSDGEASNRTSRGLKGFAGTQAVGTRPPDRVPPTTRPAEPAIDPFEPPPFQLAAFSTIPNGLHATLYPKGMSATIDVLPYRLDNVRGEITVSPERITIGQITAQHGAGTVTASGFGTVGDRPVWDLKIAARNVLLDSELRNALPPALLSVIDAVKLRGSADFEFPKFVYRGESAASSTAASQKRASMPSTISGSTSPPVDIDLATSVTFKNCLLDIGVPMTDVRGKLSINASAREGKVMGIIGDVNIDSMKVAGRDMTDVKMHLFKPADQLEMSIDQGHGNLAGGQVVGSARLSFPDDGPSRYFLSLVVRNTDLETLMQDADKDMKGQLTASLSLEGSWDDSTARRGRGDMLVTGKELYHLPLVMGLFQMTNLSLPIATPFKVGTSRYNVDGSRVNFEHIELKSDHMAMVGNGHLDFATKKVQLSFTASNPGSIKIPLINDFWNNARGELMRINIKGTIKAPKIEANSFGTFTTTVDEVFKGDPRNTD